MESARKDDSAKADLSLVPLPAMTACAQALMLGEKKYGRYNYLKGGMESHRLVAAALRHIMQWQGGEDTDYESSVTHLGHALACISMLLDQIDKGVAVDSRRQVEISIRKSVPRWVTESVIATEDRPLPSTPIPSWGE